MRIQPSLPPLFRSEAFAEDLEPERQAAPAVTRGLGPVLLLMLSAIVALAAGAATVLAGSA
jgi:hypothetical protein